MSSDPTSLSRLHDVIAPDPVPLWPLAPGWLWLLGMLALVLAALGLRGLIRFQRNRYRREALRELAQLQARADADVLADLSVLLKRTALTAFPREQVARLTGEPWFAFLDRSGGTDFSGGTGRILEDATYHAAAPGPEANSLQPLFAEVRQWIQQHQPPADEKAGDDETTGASAP